MDRCDEFTELPLLDAQMSLHKALDAAVIWEILRRVCVTSAPYSSAGGRPPIIIRLDGAEAMNDAESIEEFGKDMAKRVQAEPEADELVVTGNGTAALYPVIVATLMAVYAYNRRCVAVTVHDTTYAEIPGFSKGYFLRTQLLASTPQQLSAWNVLRLHADSSAVGEGIDCETARGHLTA